jgi:sugar (pentulose or hexulose) kinase
MEGLYSIEKGSKQKVRRLYVAGGGSQSAEICQITANMFGLPLCRIHTHEVTGVGASMVAFVAQGVFAGYEEGIRSMVHIQDEFLPNEEQHQLYRTLYNEVYSKVFDKLEPLYCEIDKIIPR